MKKILLLLLLFIPFAILFAQDKDLPSKDEVLLDVNKPISLKKKVDHSNTNWYLEMQSENPNVVLAQKYFQEYFESHPLEISRQYKLFVRWHTIAKLNIDERGFQKKQAIRKYEELQTKKSRTTEQKQRAASGTWRVLGPNNAEKTKCNGLSNYMTGGYVDRVYINPFNTQNMIAGFSYGGLWVSQDQGTTWTLTDGAFPNGTNDYANNDRYYGDIKASQTSPATIYAATEAGLLKSIDKGANWKYCNQLNRTVTIGNRPYFVAVSPDNANHLVATFGRKVFKSADGGNSWVLAYDNTNGGADHLFTNQHVSSTYGLKSRPYNFFGLEADFANANIFYLGAWNSNNEPCVYKSVNGGDSFSLLINLNKANNRIMPAHLKMQTIGANTGRFYVYAEWATADKIYTYDKNGELIREKILNTKSEAGDISWTNQDVFYNGHYASSSIHKSIDGGSSFTDMMKGSYGGCPDGDKYVHADVRAIDVVGDLVLIGTDGGMSLSKDGMLTAKTIGDEISSVDLWGFSSSQRSDICVAGMDHGPSTIRKYDGVGGWHERGGGDAIHASVNQSHDRWVYYDTQYGVYREFVGEDGTLSLRDRINPPFNVNELEFHPNIFTIGYGINDKILYRTSDHFSTFEKVYTFGQNITKFKISREEPTVMYVILSSNKVKKSTDSGQSWTDISPVFIGVNIVDIALGDKANQVYLALGNWQNERKIVRSIDGGNSWQNISTSNLPTAPVSAITYQEGTDGGVYMAFAGMNGVWYKNNQMLQWEELGDGDLPMFAYVKNIFAVPNKGKYRMGSSRGVWEHDLYENSAPIANFSVATNKVSCSNETIEFVQNSAFMPGTVSYNWSFPGGTPASSNEAAPRVGYAEAGNYDVSLTVTDQNGRSHTKLLKAFIEVTDECEIGLLTSIKEKFICKNPISEGILLNEGEEVLVKDFALEAGKLFYVNLNVSVDCSSKTASLKAIIDITNQKINSIEYHHFGLNSSSPITGDGSATISSFYSDFGQIAYTIKDGQLYLKLISNACGTTGKLTASCWSDLCEETIPERTRMNGGEEVLLKDFASEEGDLFYANLNSYMNCYSTTSSLIAIIDIVKQKIEVQDYYHFNSKEPSATSGSGTPVVTSVSTSFGQIAYRLDGTRLYFKLISNACGSYGKPTASCWTALGQCTLNGVCDDGDANTKNDTYDAHCNCVGQINKVNAQVFLEGFYDSSSAQMHTKLKDKNLLPLHQPYNIPPWNYSGTESVTSIPTDAVDWVLIMSRDLNGKVLDQAAGFISRSGALMSTDGTLGIPLDQAIGNTISIHHRSHLAVRSVEPYNGVLYDFTQASNNSQLKAIEGKYMLYAGDYDASGVINNIDFNLWKLQNAVLNKYISIDGDGNTIVNNVDYNFWAVNRSKIGDSVIRY